MTDRIMPGYGVHSMFSSPRNRIVTYPNDMPVTMPKTTTTINSYATSDSPTVPFGTGEIIDDTQESFKEAATVSVTSGNTGGIFANPIAEVNSQVANVALPKVSIDRTNNSMGLIATTNETPIQRINKLRNMNTNASPRKGCNCGCKTVDLTEKFGIKDLRNKFEKTFTKEQRVLICVVVFALLLYILYQCLNEAGYLKNLSMPKLPKVNIPVPTVNKPTTPTATSYKASMYNDDTLFGI